MEDIEYTTCVPFFVTVADELEEKRTADSRRRTAEPSPWVMQEEGDA